MKTYPEMNIRIIQLLRIDDENPVSLYAAQRIEELESSIKTAAKIIIAFSQKCPKRFNGCDQDCRTLEKFDKCWIEFLERSQDEMSELRK